MEASTEQRSEERDDEERDEREEGRDGSDETLVGRIEEVQGVVVEVAFPDDQLPDIYTALEIEMPQATPASGFEGAPGNPPLAAPACAAEHRIRLARAVSAGSATERTKDIRELISAARAAS